MSRKLIVVAAGLVATASAANTDGNTGFKGDQPDGNAYTAGGTSKPCTGLYCQDNPLGNPCPCPLWKPCKHDNVGDGHCMKPVNIAGKYDPCAYRTDGTWTAVIAGKENLGDLSPLYGLGAGVAKGNCMCTAGSTDIYQSVTWGNCDAKNPRYCETAEGVTTGNACPPENCDFWWGQYSACSSSCGGGTQMRAANVLKEARHGGTACPAPEPRPCNPQACPTPAPVTPYNPPSAPQSGGGGGGSCACVDKPKVNGRWPPNYTPCAVAKCKAMSGCC